MGASIPRGTSASSRNGSKPPPDTFFKEADRKYGLTRLRLCDLGCSYGMNFVHCHEDAYRVEFDDRESDFPQRLGLTVFEGDFVRNDVFDPPQSRSGLVWCGAVLEARRIASSVPAQSPPASRAERTLGSVRAGDLVRRRSRSPPASVGSEDTSSAIWRATTSMRSHRRRSRSRVSEPDSRPSRLSRSRRRFPAPPASSTGSLRWRASSTARPTSVAPIPNWEYHPKATRQASSQVSN